MLPLSPCLRLLPLMKKMPHTTDYTNIFRPLLRKFWGFLPHVSLLAFTSGTSNLILSFLYMKWLHLFFTIFWKHRYFPNFHLRRFHFPNKKSVIFYVLIWLGTYERKCHFLTHQPHCHKERSLWIESHFYQMSGLLNYESKLNFLLFSFFSWSYVMNCSAL